MIGVAVRLTQPEGQPDDVEVWHRVRDAWREGS